MDDESGTTEDPLRARRERSPDRLAVIDVDADREWTFAEFDAFVDRVASRLAAAGIEGGDTVATILDSRPLTAALPFATIRLGATLAPLNVALDRSTITEQVERVRPDVLLCSEETESVATAAFDDQVLSIDRPSESGVRSFDVPSGETRPERSQDGPTPGGVDPDATALMVFTSGTTGRPKGVRLTLGNLHASAVASATRLGVTPQDRWLSPLSTYHIGGLAPFLRSVLYGTTAVLQREFDADATVRTLEQQAITCVSLVPTMLRTLLDGGWKPGEHLRFVLLGGGPADEALLDRCLDRGIPVCPTYGTTETASQVATATPGDVLVASGTVGRPLADADVSIVADGRAVAPGETGELLVDGLMVSPGYLDERATADAFEDGAFRTADLGYRDDAGRLRIVGRADDVIVTGGENVQPSTVVPAIEAHPGVDEAAVVGIPDEEWGERVVAAAVAERDVASDDLREWLRGRIPDFAVPKSIAFVDSLPRTTTGTIDREAVRGRFR